jgi:hypothetical protein
VKKFFARGNEIIIPRRPQVWSKDETSVYTIDFFGDDYIIVIIEMNLDILIQFLPLPHAMVRKNTRILRQTV